MSGRGVYLRRSNPLLAPHCMQPFPILYSVWVPLGQTKITSPVSVCPKLLPRARKPFEKFQAKFCLARQARLKRPEPGPIPLRHCSKPLSFLSPFAIAPNLPASFPMAPP
jgi:hypothetical protein